MANELAANRKRVKLNLKIARYVEAQPKGPVEMKQLLSLQKKHFAEVIKKLSFLDRHELVKPARVVNAFSRRVHLRNFRISYIKD